METKVCCTCKLSKQRTRTFFGFNRSKKDGFQDQCLLCARLKDKKHYKRSDTRRRQIRSSNQALVKRNRNFVYNYLSHHPCIDCQEKDTIVLDFDHVRGVKFKDVCLLVAGGASIDTSSKEIEKCDVRCCNCHRRRTAKQFNWYVDANVA